MWAGRPRGPKGYRPAARPTASSTSTRSSRKKLGGGSWFTAEGAYYYDSVAAGSVTDSFYLLAAYASPVVGVGNIQPMVRYQWEKIKEGTGTSPWNLDVGLSYLIKGPALRVIATYSHTYLATDTTANAIQLGAQAIFF